MKRILEWNPEFAKNIWMEFSIQRLIAMPAIILLVVILILTNFDNSLKAWEILHWASLSGFIIIGLFWGIKNAADSIIDEYNDKTWDWQKMSIIGPWKLACGKLFGSTIYNWYGALICWFFYMVSATTSVNPANELKTGILLIICMISLHGLMLIIALQAVRKNDGLKKIKNSRIFIVGILFVIFFSNVFSSSILTDRHSFKASWYFISGDTTDIAILSAVFYCLWIIAALYRSMRAELQFYDAPKWWLIFLISSLLFQYGFVIGSEYFTVISGLTLSFAIVFFETLFIVYFLALSEAKDIVNFRLLVNSFKLKEYKIFFQNVPLWVITLPIAFLLGILVVIFYSFTTLPAESSYILKYMKVFEKTNALWSLIALMGFVIRDLGILLLLNFSKRAKRADAAMIVYLLLLYFLLPLLTKDFGIGVIFYPNVNAGIFAMVLFPLLEAAIVLFLVIRRWKEINKVSVL